MKTNHNAKIAKLNLKNEYIEEMERGENVGEKMRTERAKSVQVCVVTQVDPSPSHLID